MSDKEPDYKEGKWARQIIELQREDGGWGCFHTLSQPTKERPITTEQALRRLWTFGFTKEDPPVKRALKYMEDVLAGKTALPDRREKVINWDAFERLMLSTWIRLFDPEHETALETAHFWGGIVSSSFRSSLFSPEDYAVAYRNRIPRLYAGERIIMPMQFYLVHMLQGVMEAETEKLFFDMILRHETGIYYVYSGRVDQPPEAFGSRQASHYLAALECLMGYACARDKLEFAADWILDNRDESGGWDMGPDAKDGVHFPLSDSWRDPKARREDCAIRIHRLLERIGSPFG